MVNGARQSQEPMGGLPPGKILESGGLENAISQLTIDMKVRFFIIIKNQ